MIHVSKELLTQVEYLISQSTQGNHVLFDTDTLRRVFHIKAASLFSLGHELTTPWTEAEAYETEPLLERLIQQPSLECKRAFLAGLDRPTLDRVVRTYFNIVENNIFESLQGRH